MYEKHDIKNNNRIITEQWVINECVCNFARISSVFFLHSLAAKPAGVSSEITVPQSACALSGVCYIAIYICRAGGGKGFNWMCIVHIEIRCTVPHLWIYSCFWFQLKHERKKKLHRSTWNSNYNTHLMQRTKPFASATSDTNHTVLLRLQMNVASKMQRINWKFIWSEKGRERCLCVAGKICLFSLANCTLCDSMYAFFASGDSL